MAVLAYSSQRSVANPLLNQIPWNAVLLKQRHPTVTKRARRLDGIRSVLQSVPSGICSTTTLDSRQDCETF
jgi:hypothetical protein